jgi:uncharacterized membrane protein
MKSRAAIAGHPLHPIFVCIPIGLWCFAPVCDLIFHLGWGDDSWKKAALYCLAGGLIAAVPALITGWIDYSLVREPAAARVAKFHLVINLCVLPIMAASIWLRWLEVAPAYHLLPVIISLVGVLLVGISGWLGGELVSRYHISVHERATPSRPSRP